MKRTPLKRGAKGLKRTAMRRTAGTSGRAEPGRKLAAVCMAATPVCTGRAEHRHHLAGRGKPGTTAAQALDRLTLDVCARCHLYIHANPAESYERGWMLHRTGRVLP